MDMIEGRNPVIEALRSGRPMSKVLLARNIERHSAIAEILHLSGERGIPVEYVARSALDRLGQTPNHQGVIAFAAVKEYALLDDLFTISKERGELPFYVVLDGVADPHNLGSVLRTAEATGVHGVVVRERRAVGLTPAVAKASAGAVEYIPVARVINISQTVETLKKNNIWVVGIDRAGGLDYRKVDFKLPTAIVIGGEGEGLPLLTRKRCDLLAFIPMRGKINSLNASIAAAVVMYEVLRQRDG